MLHFSKDLCDPSKSTEFLNSLTKFANSQDDPDLARNISLFINCSSTKRKRESEFKDMNEFYEALHARGHNEEDIGIIKNTFDEQRIKVNVLSRLTDEDLKEYGIKQGRLRKSILAVLGK